MWFLHFVFYSSFCSSLFSQHFFFSSLLLFYCMILVVKGIVVIINLTMPVVKKKGGAKSKKAKAPKIEPDPDAAYKEQLSANLYIPRNQRAKIDGKYAERVSEVIETYQLTEPVGDTIPLTKISFIIRTLGLAATSEQVKQICTMVQIKLPSERQPGADGLFVADKAKLHKVLSDILRTRILNYNPQELQFPDPKFPNRVSSILYKAEESRIEACFTTLWKACGSMYTDGGAEESVRCIGCGEVKKIALDSPELLTGEDELSKQEVEDFLFTFKNAQTDVIREDTFLLMMLDVK